MFEKKIGKLSFDEFLFLYFGLKKERDVFLDSESEQGFDLVEQSVFSKKENLSETHPKNLKKVLADIDNEQLFQAHKHQHENEWYHAFRDAKHEIIKNAATKHHQGHDFRIKSETRELWHHVDNSFSQILFRIERLFHIFPLASKVAVIYAFAFLFSIPLLLISFNAGFSQESKMDEVYVESPKQAIILDQKTKSNIVAKNSATLLNSGEESATVIPGVSRGMVAGAYEEYRESNAVFSKIVLVFDKAINIVHDLKSIVR